MSYEDRQANNFAERKDQIRRDELYANLEKQVDRLESLTQLWVDTATQLHADSSSAEEKSDVIELRDQLVARLRAVLEV